MAAALACLAGRLAIRDRVVSEDTKLRIVRPDETVPRRVDPLEATLQALAAELTTLSALSARLQVRACTLLKELSERTT